jgi:hypothetical protein
MILNKLQYNLAKPWRFVQKKPRRFVLYLNKYLFFIGWMFDLVIYVLLTPLRFVNATYYNLVIHAFWSVRDCWLEIWAPKITWYAVSARIQIFRYCTKKCVKLKKNRFLYLKQ